MKEIEDRYELAAWLDNPVGPEAAVQALDLTGFKARFMAAEFPDSLFIGFEIFQDAAQNHYGTAGCYTPMILLGRDYWTHHKPVWPLLEQLSSGH